MSHETIVYGFIEGVGWRREDYRKYQLKNIDTVSSMKGEEWPYLTKRMFSCADPAGYRETFKRQVLHFGASAKEHGIECVDEWIQGYRPSK